MRMLKLGDVGEDVRQVQNDIMKNYYDDPAYQRLFKEELAKHKYPLERLKPDGRFGTKTQAAVIAFERFKKLKSTNGVVGPETRLALYGGVVHIRATAFTGSLASPPPYLQLDPSFYVDWAKAIKAGSPLPQVPLPPPVPPAIHQDKPDTVMLKFGETYNHRIRNWGSYPDGYYTINMDLLALIHEWPSINLKLLSDLGFVGGGGGKTPGTVPSVTGGAAVVIGTDFFKIGRWSLGGSVGARGGIGIGGSTSNPSDPSPFGFVSGTFGVSVSTQLPGGFVLGCGPAAGATLKETRTDSTGKYSKSGNWTAAFTCTFQHSEKPNDRH